MSKPIQWHPLFAHLLRPVVEEYYEVQTNVPVGDVPREADLVLLRKKTAGVPPFRGIWTSLTTWSILEFKSPGVTPEIEDIDLLVELGLGIHRRLNAEQSKRGVDRLGCADVSFWYLANRLRQRFLRHVGRRLGGIEATGAGVWQAKLLERRVFLVSNADLPIDVESLPLHVVSYGPQATELAVARFVAEHAGMRQMYGHWLSGLHKQVWKEVRAMARTVDEELKFDIEGLVDFLGIDEVIRQMGLKRVIDEVGLKRVIDEVGVKRVIDEVGVKRVIDEVGAKRLVPELGADELIASLSPSQRRELKRRLK